jgi:hypothetical protein
MDPLDEIEDIMAADFDLTKLGVDVQTRFLDREIILTFSAPDDKTFNVLTKIVDVLKDAYTKELQHLRHTP